jgi:hypothetical protein
MEEKKQCGVLKHERTKRFPTEDNNEKKPQKDG